MANKEIEWRVLFDRMHGSLGKKEEELFRKWYNSNPLHRGYYHRMEREWRESGDYSPDIPRLIKEFDAFWANHNRLRKVRMVAVRYAAAAVVVIACGVGIWRLGFHTQVTENDTAIVPGSKKAILIMEDSTRIHIENNALSETLLAQGIEILDDGNCISYSKNLSDTNKVIYNTIIIPRGGEYSLALPDGTRIWNNSETTVRFPTNIAGPRRHLYLSGEAYFAVANDQSRPFVVETELGTIKVLGTEFNVACYSDTKYIKATLVEGSLEFALPNGKVYRLNPGYQLTYSKGDEDPVISEVVVANEIAWRSDNLTFDRKPLSEIMLSLSRWYDIEVAFESSEIENMLFSGSINRYENFHSFTELFEASALIQFDIKGKQVTIRQKTGEKRTSRAQPNVRSSRK